MKNIIILTNSLLKGGTEKQAVQLATILQSYCNITFIIFHSDKINNELMNQLNVEKINVITLSGRTLLKIWKLFKIISKTPPIILFNYLLFPNFVGGIIGKLSGVKYTIGGIRSAFLERNKIFLNKFSQNHINRYTIYNNYKGLEFTNKYGFNNKKAIVIPNCILLNKDSIKHNHKEIVSILSVGRFDYSKDYLTALKTINFLLQNKNNINYTIVGWGELENNLRKWVIDLQLEKYVNIIINPSDLTKYYTEANIFFQTSIFEGLSNTIMEAMNYSLPIIATDVGDNDKLVIHGKNGFLANNNDINMLTNYTQVLVQSYSLRTKFGKYSFNHLKNNYSKEIFKQKYIKLINSLN